MALAYYHSESGDSAAQYIRIAKELDENLKGGAIGLAEFEKNSGNHHSKQIDEELIGLLGAY